MTDAQRGGLRALVRTPAGAGAVVFVASITAILVTKQGGVIAPFWPANGIALLFLLRGNDTMRFRIALVSAFILAFVAANRMAGQSWLIALAFTVGNLAEIAAAFWVLRRPARRSTPGEPAAHTRQLAFVLAAALLGPAAGATIGGSALSGLSGESLPGLWLVWFLPSMLSFLIVAPLGVMAAKAHFAKLRRIEGARDLAIVLCGLGIATAAVVLTHRLTMFILAAPVVLFAAVQLRALGAALSVCLLTCLAIPMASGAFGLPLFSVWTDSAERIAMMQAFLAVVGGVGLAVAAVLEERDALLHKIDMERTRAQTSEQAKARVLMHVSHEIRTSLNAIQGLSERIPSAGPLTDRQSTLLDGVIGAAQHLQDLSRDLLDAARLEADALSMSPAWIEAAPIIRDVIEQVLSSNETHARIQMRVADDARAWADPVRFQQIATNFLTNAVKHAGAYGPIVIGVSCSKDAARIEVIDRGPGLSIEERHAVFEPFALQDSSRVPGTGIGLSIVKALAEAHGGVVGCVSTPFFGDALLGRASIPTHASGDGGVEGATGSDRNRSGRDVRSLRNAVKHGSATIRSPAFAPNIRRLGCARIPPGDKGPPCTAWPQRDAFSALQAVRIVGLT